MSHFIAESYYVLARTKSDGAVEYYAIDHHSGGYPYWSSSFGNAQKFHQVDKIPVVSKSGDNYLLKGSLKIEAMKIECVATVFSSEQLVDAAMATAMEEIAKIETELNLKIAALKKMEKV